MCWSSLHTRGAVINGSVVCNSFLCTRVFELMEPLRSFFARAGNHCILWSWTRTVSVLQGEALSKMHILNIGLWVDLFGDQRRLRREMRRIVLSGRTGMMERFPKLNRSVRKRMKRIGQFHCI